MNLMNGLLMKCPTQDLGAIRYIMDSIGYDRHTLTQSSILKTTCFLLNPGRPSYHREARSCWQFGCATNWNGIEKGVVFLVSFVFNNWYNWNRSCNIYLQLNFLANLISKIHTSTQERNCRRSAIVGCQQTSYLEVSAFFVSFSMFFFQIFNYQLSYAVDSMFSL